MMTIDSLIAVVSLVLTAFGLGYSIGNILFLILEKY